MTVPILIDTHFVIWFRTRPHTLTRGEQAALDTATARFVSAVSLWELAILVGLGRLPVDSRWQEIPQGFELLPIRPEHCGALIELPRLHGDPFDRMLIAQARSEQITLLTRDRIVAAYNTHAAILRNPRNGRTSRH